MFCVHVYKYNVIRNVTVLRIGCDAYETLCRQQHYVVFLT